MQSIDLFVLFEHRKLTNLDVDLLQEKAVVIDFSGVVFHRADHDSSSLGEIVNVREKAVDADVDVRHVLIPSLFPQRGSCDVAGAPLVFNKVVNKYH